jgi:hypothetical protein
MAAESYDNYLRLLKLPRSATEQDIRTAIFNEERVWARKQNAATLDARQEAERKVQTLQAAEKVLLGPEGQIIRSGFGSEPADVAQLETSVDAETVARAIDRVTSVRGTKAQERRGTVLYRRATIFYHGVDFLVEELVHKKYESTQDRKRCCATQGGLMLFDWSCEIGASPVQARTATYIQGPWVVALVAFAAECEGR